MESKTLNELVDLAIERLPRWQARFVKLSLACRPRKRSEVVNAVAFRMAHDVNVRAILQNPAVFAAENIDGETSVQFSAVDLDKLLEIIVDYLPAIIQIILMFVQLLLPLALVFALSTSANAQWVCDENGCRQVQPSLAGGECVDGRCSTAAVARQPVRNLAQQSATIAAASARRVPRVVLSTEPVARKAVKAVRAPVSVIRSRRPVRSFLKRVFCR